VGHQFPIYFVNAVRSVLLMAPNDDVLVVDNASGSATLVRELQEIARREPRVRLLLRDSNDMSRNTKVGGLYDAYNEVAADALNREYDYLHIMQNDMQMLWWDDEIIAGAARIYAKYPECVNIYTVVLPRHVHSLSADLEYEKPKLAHLRNYGLTDAGLYDLKKWRARGMRFMDNEQAHARKYREEGLRVFCHPVPAVAQIPWPAVVRNGRIIGREVQPREDFLLRPLTPAEIDQITESTELTSLEAAAIPWGWTCLTPYWITDLRSIHYLAARRADIRARGVRAALPRWERRGLPPGTSVLTVQRQPQYWFWQLLVEPLFYAGRRVFPAVLPGGRRPLHVGAGGPPRSRHR